MSTIWQTVTWDVARAGGFTAYVLLTLVVAMGLALSTQLQSPSRWPRLLNNELHNFLTLLSTIFLGVHVLAVVVDPFTHFGWNEILIPLASHYRLEWMALGIVGLYLGIAIGISTLLRKRIGYKWWRRLHVLTLGIFALATIHGLGTGSDAQTWWALGIYLVSIVLVGSLLCRRVFSLKGKRKHTTAHPVAPARSMSAGSAEQPTHAEQCKGCSNTCDGTEAGRSCSDEINPVALLSAVPLVALLLMSLTTSWASGYLEKRWGWVMWAARQKAAWWY